MRKPNPEIEQAEHELQFAQQQVESGQRALNNPDIDPKVAQRVSDAVKHWENQQQIAQVKLNLLRSQDGTPQ